MWWLTLISSGLGKLGKKVTTHLKPACNTASSRQAGLYDKMLPYERIRMERGGYKYLTTKVHKTYLYGSIWKSPNGMQTPKPVDTDVRNKCCGRKVDTKGWDDNGLHCITTSIMWDRGAETMNPPVRSSGSYNVVPSHEPVTQTRPLREHST